MHKKFYVVPVLIILLSLSLLFVSGFFSRGGGAITITNKISDDLYAFGNSVQLLEDVEQDFITAGGNINVQGNVGQDLIASGGMLDITGNIGDDARIAGGIVNINSDISDDLVVAGGRVTIGKDATIGGDLVITGGILNIEGQVKDRVFATGGNVVIAGQVGKDVRVDQVDSLTVSSSASIGGNLSYSSIQPASIAEGAEISGQLNFEQIEKEKTLREKTKFGAPFAIFTATYIGGKILSFISLFVLGILLILAIPRVFEKFSQRLRISLGNSVGAGAIALFGIPLTVLVVFIISIFFMVTVIGSGIGLLLMGLNLMLAIAYFILIYLSTIFLAYLLGKSIFSRSSVNLGLYGWKVLAYLVGLAIISIAFAIPFIGWLARLAAIMFGLGGLLLVIKDWLAGLSNKV